MIAICFDIWELPEMVWLKSRRRNHPQFAPCYYSRMRALVTGGTGRLGSAIAARLQQDGWSVRATGRADGDIAEVAQARALVTRATEELNGLDLLVNSAGAGFTPKQVAELEEDDWDAAFGATAKGSFFVSQAAAPHLRASRGCIVMIEDVAAYQPWPSFAAHCAAKAAQAMLTRVLARALAPEVRVCGIAPGPVAVEPDQEERRAAETLLGRVGEPDDVASAVAYLATAEFVTGTTLFVDGGRALQSGIPPGS
jgi:pteridine reductase